MIWLKQRYAHLVLAPAPSNPMVRRWINPYKHIAQVGQRFFEWREARKITEDIYVDYQTPFKDLIGLLLSKSPAQVRSCLVTDIAHKEDEPNKVYVKADLLPLFGYLGLGEYERQVQGQVWRVYRDAMVGRKPDGVSTGEQIAAIGYWFGLSGIDDEFLDVREKSIKVGLGTAGQHSGGTLIGHWAAVQALESEMLSPLAIGGLSRLYEDTVIRTLEREKRLEESKRIKDLVRQIKDEVLEGVLKGDWTRRSWRAVKVLLEQHGYDPTAFLSNLKEILKFVIEHQPHLAEAFGIVEEGDEEVDVEEGKVKVGEIKVDWDTLSGRLYSGSGLRGDRPFLIDIAEWLANRFEVQALKDAKGELVFWDVASKKMPKEQWKEIVASFKRVVTQKIPDALKSQAEALLHGLDEINETEVKGVDDIKDRLEHFLGSDTWWDMLKSDKEALEDAFLAYLYRLAELGASHF